MNAAHPPILRRRAAGKERQGDIDALRSKLNRKLTAAPQRKATLINGAVRYAAD
jgi:hypothetical protein